MKADRLSRRGLPERPEPNLYRGALVALALASSACGVGTKEALLREALDDVDDRQEYFEAILRVLDDYPRYVDEFFVQARDHDPTLDRFIKNAADHLHEDELAEMTAKYLVQNPAGLRRILVASLLAARDEPEARAAIAGAIGAEVELATDIMSDDPELVREAMLGTVRHVAMKPEARRAFVQAMYGASPVIASILAGHPKVMTKMFEALTAELSDRPEQVRALLGELAEAATDGDEEDAEGDDGRVPTRGE